MFFGRYGVFGVGIKEKIYIVGGCDEWCEVVFSCLVFNVFINEWSMIGSLSCFGVKSMVICNELLCVVSVSMFFYF